MSNLYYNFPSDLASNVEKKDFAFGQQVAEALDNQWFNGNLTSRRYWIDLMRSYSRGEQSYYQYKDTIEGKKDEKSSDVDMKTHKIDYKTLKIMPVFKAIITNSIDESLFKPRAEAIDITAINEKRDFFKKLDKNFHTQRIASIIGKGIGVNLTPPNSPRTKEELDVKKVEYKPLIEIAQELTIENVLKLEKFETVKNKTDEDLFDLGFCVIRHWTDPSSGIKIKYTDPYNFIHNDFEYDDGRDIRYAGVMIQGTIADIEKEAGRVLRQDELNEIKKYSLSYHGSSEEFTPYTADEDGERTFEYLSFAYLTRRERIHKKLRGRNKTARLIDRSEDGYEPDTPSKKITTPYKTWYEGIWIPSARILVKWQELENQVVDGVENPVCPFLIAAPNVKKLSEKGDIRFDSAINRTLPIIDDLHRDWFKFQQLKMELRPNTIEIDTNAINQVALNGEVISPQDILDLFFGRGLLLKRGFDEDGEEIAKAITEVDGGMNNTSLVFLSNEFTNNYNRLRQLLGINELKDGTAQPNNRTAVTVQKLLLASSNNATSHIVRSSFELSLRVCEAVSYRLKDILKNDELREQFISAVGSTNVELLDVIKEIPAHTFGIYFDFEPDNEERVAFEQSLIASSERGEINSGQYNTLRQIRNAKSAIKHLEYVIDLNRKKAQEEKIQNIKLQAEANAQTSIKTEQSKQQTKKQETDDELLILREKDRLDEEKSRRDAIASEFAKQLDHKRNMELKRLEVVAKQSIAAEGENRKDDRVDKQDTNESKKIHQRQNNTAPIDFESKFTDIFNTKTTEENIRQQNI
ncbi:MAG: hypothetical protein QM499_00950 [Flavobacteriaceae bacterium]